MKTTPYDNGYKVTLPPHVRLMSMEELSKEVRAELRERFEAKMEAAYMEDWVWNNCYDICEWE